MVYFPAKIRQLLRARPGDRVDRRIFMLVAHTVAHAELLNTAHEGLGRLRDVLLSCPP